MLYYKTKNVNTQAKEPVGSGGQVGLKPPNNFENDDATSQA